MSKNSLATVGRKLDECQRRLEKFETKIEKFETHRNALWEKEGKLKDEKRKLFAQANIGKCFSSNRTRYHIKIESFENDRIIVSTVTRNSIILGSPQHSLPDDIEPCSELVFAEAVSKVVEQIEDVLMTGSVLKTESVVYS